MKTIFAPFTLRTSALALAIAFGFAVTSRAATENKTTTLVPLGKRRAVAAAAATGVASTGTQNAVGMLDQAYGLLRDADHDYKGHRVHAMHAIESAARELGTKLSGGGPGKEKQATSDSQLNQAQSLLEQAISGLTGRAHHHIQVAISQLTTALKIK